MHPAEAARAQGPLDGEVAQRVFALCGPDLGLLLRVGRHRLAVLGHCLCLRVIGKGLRCVGIVGRVDEVLYAWEVVGLLGLRVVRLGGGCGGLRVAVLLRIG